jgi:hypothetical protein
VRSLRSKAAVWLLPSTGREGEALKRLGLGAGLSMLRIVRICVVGSEGQRKRGGRAKSRRVGWRGGIAMCRYVCFTGGGGIRCSLVLLKFVGETRGTGWPEQEFWRALLSDLWKDIVIWFGIKAFTE